MNDLPDELIVGLLGFLPSYGSLLRTVCRRWRDVYRTYLPVTNPYNLVEIAMHTHNLKLLKWINKSGYVIPLDACGLAIRSGSVPIVKWMYEHRYKVHYLYESAIILDHGNVLNYLLQTGWCIPSSSMSHIMDILSENYCIGKCDVLKVFAKRGVFKCRWKERGSLVYGSESPRLYAQRKKYTSLYNWFVANRIN